MKNININQKGTNPNVKTDHLSIESKREEFYIFEKRKAEEKDYNNFKKILKEKSIKKSMLISFCNIFCPCLVKNQKNISYLIKIQDFVNEELDIVKIVKKLIEYENFKGLILTENQIKLLNLFQKRILNQDFVKKESIDIYKQLYFNNKMKSIEEYSYLIDNLFEFDYENENSPKILDKLKRTYKA